MNQSYSIYLLKKKIDTLSKLVDVKKIIEGDKNTPDQIRLYYKINNWAYRRYHSHEGFMHFRVSKNGVMTDEDPYHQPDVVYGYIKPGALVVELGYGQGTNIRYLSNSCPEAHFMGFDLQPLRDLGLPSNVEIFEQDYSSLPQIADGTVDVIYGFETIVHNTDKEKVFKEACRVLKPGGIMIIYDYALKMSFEEYDQHFKTAIALISKGGASAMIESLEEWNKHFTNSGLTIESVTDYTESILPDMKRLERKAHKILSRPWLTKLMFTCLPSMFVNNIILGWLGYNAFKTGLGYYKEWKVRKP